MANYGLPYQGSKDKIVHKIASVFPPAENFYDIFGGGFSVTHYMILHHSKKYKNFYFNELEPTTVDLIKDAISGKYNYKVFKPEWIDRETFFKKKDQCAYTRIVWSFGNNMKSFMFGKDIESDKRSLHQAIVFDDFDSFAIKVLGFFKWPAHLSIRGRRLLARDIVRKKAERMDLQQLERLEQLEQLERLERLEQLERLELSSLSYDQIKIKQNSVIYCDPPYIGTAKYLHEFDHNKFWTWFRSQSEPTFVSEYTAPSDIKVIMALNHKKNMSSKGQTNSVEKLYANDAAIRAISKHL